MRARPCIIVVLLIAFTLFSSFGHTKERINIIYPSISGLVLGLWVTKDAGIFDKHGLDVNLIYIQSATAVIQAMIGGEAPIVLSGGKPVVDLGLEGGDPVFIAGITTVPAFYVMAMTQIRSVEDLKGKPVGVTRFGSSSDFTMRVLLKKHGLEPVRDVPILQIGGGMQGMAAALLKKAIFAAPFSPPTNLEVEKAGGHVLVDMAKAGIPFPHVSIVSSRFYIRNYRAVATAVLRAYSEGVKRMVGDKAFSLHVLQKYTRSKDPEVLESTYKFALDYVIRVPYPPREGIAEVLRQSTHSNARQAKPDDLIDDSMVQELEQSGVYR